MDYFYVEKRSVSDDRDYVIIKTQAETKRGAVQKIKERDIAKGRDPRDFTYVIQPNSKW